jgi:hypothetical protein
MPKFLPLLFLVALVAGCAKPLPEYSHTAQSSDATVVFNSGFDLHTFFIVNTDPAGANFCDDYRRVGFILHKDSIFLFDDPNHEIKIQVPADQPLSIRAWEQFSDGISGSYCGSVELSFTPEKNKTYIVTMDERKSDLALSGEATGTGQRNINTNYYNIFCGLSIKEAQSMTRVQGLVTSCSRKN